MGDESFRLGREIEAAKVLSDTYRDLIGDDEDLRIATLEGETSLFERMEALLESMEDDKVIVTGLKAREAEMKERRERFEHAIERKRTILLTAMQVAGLKKHTFATATLSRSEAAPKLDVIEESEIPSQFFEPQPPRLARAKLTAALREREKAISAAEAIEDPEARQKRLAEIEEEVPPLPGAELRAGGESLTIRRK